MTNRSIDDSNTPRKRTTRQRTPSPIRYSPSPSPKRRADAALGKTESPSKDAVLQNKRSTEEFVDPAESFKARASMLDPHHLFAQKSSARGIMTIFWVFLTYQSVLLMWSNWKKTGKLVSDQAAKSFFGDGLGFWMLESLLIAISYGGLALQVFECYGRKHKIAWMTSKRPLYWIARTVLEGTIIAMPIVVSVNRGWHAIQRGSYLLHSLSIGMKVHSYLSVNEQNKRPVWPSFSNYTLFLLAPTLVYSQVFPRSQGIRWWFVVEKLAASLIIFTWLYLTVEYYIYPVLVYDLDHENPLSFLEAMLRLFPPMLAAALLLFFLTFECLLNFFAELSCFADKHFYSDWWNSTSYAEFARKWNVPVHRFLLYHVYLQSIRSLRISKFWASTLTFFISSAFHELVLSVMLGRGPYFYFSALQMLQIPLIWLGSRPFIQARPVLANFAFWISLTLGLPLLTVIYCREHYKIVRA